MSLCSLCLTVPWLSLPPPREIRGAYRVADKDELLRISNHPPADENQGSQSLRQPLAIPFHKNLKTLRLSAKSCPLCAVVQAGVQTWIDDWEDSARNNKSFIEFNKDIDRIPVEEQLWVTARYGGAQGFYIWADHPKHQSMYSWYFLTAVGFSVDSGIVLPISYSVLCVWDHTEPPQITLYRSTSQCGHWR